jgi:Baseplate J-like protein
MTLQAPSLDTRDFDSLVADAHTWIGQRAPGWSDLSASDPGIVLVELFAYLTDLMIYRLNQLPEKAYVEFLRLLGLTLKPPSAAVTTLMFALDRPSDQAVLIPRGTRVTAGRAGSQDAPVFLTAQAATIDPGKAEVDVVAHNCELVVGELAGTGTGAAGLTVVAKRPPIVAPTGDELDLVVGVEAQDGELASRDPAIEFEGRPFGVWIAVDSFSHTAPDDRAYTVDRMSGVITFAPAVRKPVDGGLDDAPSELAAAPPAGREIRLWYRRGGGAAGNVGAETLTTLKDSIPGVRVTNPMLATGGRDGESVANALLRGPQDAFSVEAAVRAADYEAIARGGSGAVARARAFTQAAMWRHATPGTVEVLLVPHIAEADAGGRVTAAQLRDHETEPALEQVRAALDERRPLGTTCLVNWARYKTVKVKAKIVVRREESREAVAQRVATRLHETINPLPTKASSSGWRFGQPLRSTDVLGLILNEPGVQFAESLRLVVEEVPNSDVTSIAADAFQPRTWFAGSGSILFRSQNDGEGWEASGRFPDEQIRRVRVHPQRPGLIAVATSLPDGASRVHVSQDDGETWDPAAPSTTFEIHDVAWLTRDATPVLLLASGVGLYELPWVPGGVPVPVLVVPEDHNRGFDAVCVSIDFRGNATVAVASQGSEGVYLSDRGGVPESFRPIGLGGHAIRVLAVQRKGPSSFLWAGTAAAGGDDPGEGCFRWEILGSADPPEGWQAYGVNWTGGSCWGLAFKDDVAYAATHHGGVVRLDVTKPSQQWEGVGLDSGLPLRDPGRFLFLHVNDVATDMQGRVVLVGGAEGTYRSLDAGANYESACTSEFRETVTLPDAWLFASGEHELTVVSEDEAGRD